MTGPYCKIRGVECERLGREATTVARKKTTEEGPRYKISTQICTFFPRFNHVQHMTTASSFIRPGIKQIDFSCLLSSDFVSLDGSPLLTFLFDMEENISCVAFETVSLSLSI
jgi:hypothetical protein